MGVLIALFNVPSIEMNDPIESYTTSILEAYQGIIENLITTDPYALRLLLEAVVPLGYNSRIKMNYYTTAYAVTGVSEDVPYELYLVLPVEASTGLSSSGIESNWYRSVFTIENSGSSALENQSMELSVSIIPPDLNADGLNEPVDLNSLQIFTDEGLIGSQVESYEFVGGRFVVVMSADVGKIEAGETKRLYVYYLVGDDYE